MTFLPMDPSDPTPTPRDVGAVWLEDDRALIAIARSDEVVASFELARGSHDADRFRRRILDALTTCAHLIVAGPAAARLELERADVASRHAPERLADVDLAGPPDASELRRIVMAAARGARA